MRKRVLAWLLTTAMVAASLMPSVPAYAAEYVSEAAVLEASAETSEEDASVDEASVLVSNDAAGEASSEITDEAGKDETDETASEAGTEAATDEEKKTEDVEPETPGAETTDEAIEEATEEASEEASAVEDASAEESTEEEADAAASEDSEEEIPEVVEEEILVNATEDPGITWNEVGFLNFNKTHTITGYDGEDDEVIYSPCTAVTIRSKYTGIKVEIYACPEKGSQGEADKDKAVKVGENTIKHAIGYYADDALSTHDEKYYMFNSVPFSPEAFRSGDWYFFGRFYTGQGTDGYVDSKTIKLKNDSAVTGAPAVAVTDVTNVSTKSDGKAVISKSASYDAIYFGKYGAESLKWTDPDTEGDKNYTLSDLQPGKYVACYTKRAVFEDEIYNNSQTKVFDVDFKPSLQSLYIGNYATGEALSGKTLTLQKGATLRVQTSVSPSNILETGVTFKSSDPTVVSVDAEGNCKVLKDAGTSEITVTTVGKDSEGKEISKSFTITAAAATAPVKIKSAKFKESTISVDYKAGETISLGIVLDNTVTCPVYWMVDNNKVINFSSGKDESTATGGETSTVANIKGLGQAVVTANIGGVKTITCTVNVNGTIPDSEGFLSGPYFYNGKFLTGFWAFDNTTGEIVGSGTSVLKKTGVIIKYYDPVSYKPLTGTAVIDKKLYYFDKPCNLVRGTSDKDGSILSIKNVIVNKLGQLQTGWQTADGASQEYYYSPDNGVRVTSSWLPKGKGFTWVDSNGLMKDTAGNLLSVEGLHTINSKLYCFKGGLRQEGFFYFDASDTARKLTTKNSAVSASYFTPGSGEVATDFFAVSGKRYYGDSNGVITLGGRFTVGSDTYYADKTGAIVFGDKLVTDENGIFYVDEDGEIAFNQYKTIKGKIYHFNGNGYADGGDKGFKSEEYQYLENDDYKPIYIKLSNPKKATSGVSFYKDEDCTTKVTNVWITDKSENLYYADSKGNLAAGPFTVSGTKFFFDPDTLKLVKSEGIVQYKNQYYACNNNGIILTDTSDFKKVGSNWVRAKNSSGVLMTGLQTINKKKYLFSSTGELITPSTDHIVADQLTMKAYLVNSGEDYNSSKPETWYIYAPGKMILYKAGESYSYLVKKDGSFVMKGWGTVDGKKYYCARATLASETDGIVKIGGKYYTFGSDNSMQTGWKKFEGVKIMDLDSYSSTTVSGVFCFYFDPKSGALQTGWKTIKAPAVSSSGEIVTDVNGNPVESGIKKKLYFNPTASSTLPIGALIRNTDMTIGGKLYRFGADGAAIAQEGFANLDPASESYSDKKVYIKKDGTLAKGRTLVKTANGDAYFYFSLATGEKETNVFRKTGKKWYYYGSNGKQSTTPWIRETASSKEAVAVCNKDGSIKNFATKDAKEFVLKNVAIKTSDVPGTEWYFLGKDGLPMTGNVKDPSTGTIVFVEADGRNTGNYSISGTMEYRLVKNGSKYYMLRNGVVLNMSTADDAKESEEVEPEMGLIAVNPTIDVFESVFSLLTDKDRAEAARYLAFCKMVYGSSMRPIIVLNTDGSVRVGKINANGINMTTNRLGIVKDMASVVVKDGGWRISGYFRGNNSKSYYEFGAYNLANLIGSGGYTTIRFNWDSNGKITSVTDTSTGKACNGDYMVMGMGNTVTMKFKNGKIATGKVNFNYLNILSFVVDVDKEFAVGPFSLFG